MKGRRLSGAWQGLIGSWLLFSQMNEECVLFGVLSISWIWCCNCNAAALMKNESP